MIDTALVELIDRATAECTEQQRGDLQNRLRQIRTRVLDPAQLVLAVGEPKQGKSELINALVNAPVCNAGEDASTAVPTIVRHSEEPTARLVEQEPGHGPAALNRMPVPIEQVREQLDAAVGDGRPVTRGEVGLPRAILKDGLVLMDTPGVGSVSTSLTTTTLSVVTEADALLMVSDATQELTTNEISFLKQVADLCPNVALVATKTDIAPHWRQVVEVNRKHLAHAGISARIFPVSSTVRMTAMQSMDADLNTESGFPPLLDYLRNELAGQHEQLARRLVAHNVSEVINQLIDALKNELTNQNPRTATETLLELETAQRRAEELQRASSRWQKLLNDAISELYADIEFDFRERSWAVLQQVNDTFDDTDPDQIWDDFLDWLTNALTQIITENFEWLDERRRQLTERLVRELRAEYGEAFPNSERITPPDLLHAVTEPKQPTAGKHRKSDQVLTGLRGSYAGVLMFGMISTQLLGLPSLINVLSISAGMVLGSRSLTEEKDTRLQRRQAEAKSSAQRYIEQVVFHVNKESKDAIRNTHRELHSHFSEVTEQAQNEVNQEIKSIKRSAERSAVDQDRRARDIRAKLDELSSLHKKISVLTTNRIAAA